MNEWIDLKEALPVSSGKTLFLFPSGPRIGWVNLPWGVSDSGIEFKCEVSYVEQCFDKFGRIWQKGFHRWYLVRSSCGDAIPSDDQREVATAPGNPFSVGTKIIWSLPDNWVEPTHWSPTPNLPKSKPVDTLGTLIKI